MAPLSLQATLPSPELAELIYWINTHDHTTSSDDQVTLATQRALEALDRDRARRENEIAGKEIEAEPIAPHPKAQRGRNERVPEFLSRLPPSKTLSSDIGSWIWTFCPNAKKRLDHDLPSFMRKGREILLAFENQKAELRAAYDKSGAKSNLGLTQRLNAVSRCLEQDLLQEARKFGVIHGKWMLFVNQKNVDKAWAAVATALAKGNLGEGAKVATNDGSDDSRLICVYTKDFGDMEDVKRVLKGMIAVDLVDEKRPIYYKCDAYTHLDIMSKNKYGLKASLYSSRDVLDGLV